MTRRTMGRIKHRMSYPRPQELAEKAETAERKEDCSRGTIWTDDEIRWLAENYHRFPGKFCAKHLRRSYQAVRLMMHRIKFGRGKAQDVQKIALRGNVSRPTFVEGF